MKTLLAALVAGLIVVATASASPPPQQLIGKWTRTVTAADVHHAGATKVVAGLTWTLVVTQHGSTASHGTTKMRVRGPDGSGLWISDDRRVARTRIGMTLKRLLQPKRERARSL